MLTLSLYKDNDNLIVLDSLYDQGAGAYINDATVTITLTDSADEEVSGQSWPLTLSYVSDSNGKYQGVVDADAALTAGARYLADITAERGTLKGRWKFVAICRDRVV